MLKRFTDLIISCAQRGYSDVHICGGQPVVYRKDGSINFEQKIIWTHQDVDSLAQSILSSPNKTMLRQRWSVDFAATIGNVRLRISIFNTDRGPSLAIRLLPGTVPPIDKLNLHPSLQSISDLKSGLVLICGTTGCGKTTTIASILDDINHKRAAHIITLEDPIEFQISSRLSYIEQREVGTHVPSVERGLIDVMRADPDIIMVGELREPQTIALTLNAAESGHLVIATLHATNMEDALYRIINSAPPEAEEYIRHQLASTISWIIVQKLVCIEKMGFRIPLLSIMRGTQQIKGIIREKKLYQIDNAMHTGKADGMFTQDRYSKEYLETRDKYHNPLVNFKPEKGSITDSHFNSTLFDSGFDSRTKTENPREIALGDKQQSDGKIKRNDQLNLLDAETTLSLDHTDSQYSIEESYDLSEIIAQTEKNFKNKK
jgi:twitching motility protein PilT